MSRSPAGLRLVAAIRLEYVAHDAPSLRRDTPAPAAWDFCDEPAYLESFQQTTNGRTVTMSVRISRRGVKERRADVLVAESLGDVVASQHGGEQASFFLPSRVEPRVTSALVALSFRQFLQVVIARRRIVDRRQGFQIALIAGQGLALWKVGCLFSSSWGGGRSPR